jgi:hypothetical protein
MPMMPMTVCGWARSLNALNDGSTNWLIEAGTASVDGWGVYRKAAGPTARLAVVFAGVEVYEFTASQTLYWTNTNTWYFWAMSITGAGGTATGYIHGADGYFAASQSVGTPSNSNPTQLRIMAGGTSSGFAWNGGIDDVRLFNCVKSERELKEIRLDSMIGYPRTRNWLPSPTIYEMQAGGSPPSLVRKPLMLTGVGR